MDWVKLLTDLEGHPKILAVGNAGTGVYVRSLAYCGKYETDGLVPKEWAEQAIAREGQREIPAQLLAAGLWEECPDGFRIRDFTEVNRSHEEMQSLREIRSAAGKTGGQAKGKAKAKQRQSKSHSNSVSSSKSSSQEVERDDEWRDWLGHYQQATGRKSVTGSAEARKQFNARRSEGIPLEDLKLATVGCHGDAYLRERRLDRPETILRASNFRRYIELAADRSAAEGPGEASVPPPANLTEGLADLEAVWPEVVKRLEKAVPGQTVTMWIRPLRPAGKVGRDVYLTGPENVRSWSRRRYTKLIVEALGAAGHPDCSVLFIDPPDEQAVAA